MLTFLSHRDVVSILTLAQHGVLGEHIQSPADISYLADTVLLLRYFEAFGSVRRALSVVKKRSGGHETFIREMKIGPVGLNIGEPLCGIPGRPQRPAGVHRQGGGTVQAIGAGTPAGGGAWTSEFWSGRRAATAR